MLISLYYNNIKVRNSYIPALIAHLDENYITKYGFVTGKEVTTIRADYKTLYRIILACVDNGWEVM